MTLLSNGNMQNSDTRQTETPDPIKIKYAHLIMFAISFDARKLVGIGLTEEIASHVGEISAFALF
jgi:hypothetical protein